MKNRLLITISDFKGTKSYNIHQFSVKIFLFIISFIFISLFISFLFIANLNDEIDEMKKDKEYLETQIDELNSSVFVEKYEPKEEISKRTLDTIDINKKRFTLNTIPNGTPVEKYDISSSYGERIHPISNKVQFHKGIDLVASLNSPIRATADGVVDFVQSEDIGDYGKVIKIIHNYGFRTIYAHMEKTYLNVGDFVKKGQIIGLVGNTGKSTGPHLHYEVLQINNVLNPKNFINWNMEKYDDIFKNERRIEWESLINLINEQLK